MALIEHFSKAMSDFNNIIVPHLNSLLENHKSEQLEERGRSLFEPYPQDCGRSLLTTRQGSYKHVSRLLYAANIQNQDFFWLYWFKPLVFIAM